MKKRSVLLLVSFLFILSGCENVIDSVNQHLPGKEKKEEAIAITPAFTAAPKERIYMDELKGVLQNFDGSYLRILSDGTSYVLDVQNASLECEHGMVRGDEISVIYEGQLNGTNTEGMTALKVVDEVHKKKELSPQVWEGSVVDLTLNTLTVRRDDGISVIFPVTGSPQYYEDGVRSESRVYVRYKGVIAGLAEAESSHSATSDALNATLVKVLFVSSQPSFAAPAPTKAPAATAPVKKENAESVKEPEQEQKATPPRLLRGRIRGINGGTLLVLPNASDTPVNLNITGGTLWFPCGISASMGVNVYYEGDLPQNPEEPFSPVSIYGDETAAMSSAKITSAFSGAIVGSTADTFTLRTSDGALLTCRPGNAADESTGNLDIGCEVEVVFDASKNPDSNIYECLRIRDAG